MVKKAGHEPRTYRLIVAALAIQLRLHHASRRWSNRGPGGGLVVISDLFFLRQFVNFIRNCTGAAPISGLASRYRRVISGEPMCRTFSDVTLTNAIKSRPFRCSYPVASTHENTLNF